MDGPPPDIRLPTRFEAWFADRGWRPRPHQVAMLDAAARNADALLVAPTGGGKTLAGFLPSLVALAGGRDRPDRGLHTLYISPLKALAVDVARNLTDPVRDMGLPVRIEARTGDMSVSKRQRQRTDPPDILLTTPEQLALFCAWEGSRAFFADLACVVVDEIHTFSASKRGDLLALGLARLGALAPGVRRVGLSATVDDPEQLAAWMGAGGRTPEIILGPRGAPPRVDILLSDARVPWAGHTAQHAMREVYEAVRGAGTTLVFVNTRWQAEFAFQELWRLNEDNLPIALHHGSLAAEQRRRVEAAMARGQLRAVVCTSTLDLGIDWGAVDLVIQLAAPKGASRLVQRIGRSNHRMDQPSQALLVPANRFEMLECQAAREAVADNTLDQEPRRVGALDVLAQHLMGLGCAEPFDADAVFGEISGCGPYASLDRAQFDRVLGFVSDGGYALRAYDRFRRLVRGRDGLWKVRDARIALRHRLNTGAIVAPATLTVRERRGRGGGRVIGEAEEWYFESLEPGDVFLFSGRTWRLDGFSGTDVLVSPHVAEDPKIPSWGGSKFPLSTHLAQRVRRIMADRRAWANLPPDVAEWLRMQALKSSIPGPDELLVELFPNGRRWYLAAYPFEGRLAHTTLAMLLTKRLDRLGIGPLGFLANDYAVSVWTLRPMDDLDCDALFEEDMLGDDLEAWLEDSAMMKRAFRQCAMISGLIERRFPGQEKSGRQVTFSSDLIYDVLRRHDADHLLLECARADVALGLTDAQRLGELLRRVRGRLRVNRLERLSPFAVPMMAEIGRERSPGEASDMILESAALDALVEVATG